MPYRYLDWIAPADVAFEAWAGSVEELFVVACDASLGAMVADPNSLHDHERRDVALQATARDLLLFKLLEEQIYYKDSDRLLLRCLEVEIEEDENGFRLRGILSGERIDPGRQELLVDVKAVTLHRLEVSKTASGWRAVVVLDV
jgi:SHS2 domain-containing protein